MFVLVLSLKSGGRLCFVGEVVVVPYEDTVVALTVMRLLLFVLHVCMLRKCDCARVTAMLEWRMEELWVVYVVQV